MDEPMTSRCAGTCIALAAAILLAGPAGARAADDSRPSLSGRATGDLERRQRAVTGDDYQELAPDAPGVGVGRTSVSPADTSGESAEKETTGLEPPAIDADGIRRMRDDMRERIPAHTPEWSNREDDDRGAGSVTFGDGEHGARPAADVPRSGRLRSGGGTRGRLTPGAEAGIDAGLIRRVARELQADRVEAAVQLWRRELDYMARQGRAPARPAIQRAIDRVLEQAYSRQASLARPAGHASLESRDGEDDDLANVDLQGALQKQQQSKATASAVEKQLHDAAMSIIRKLR